MSQKTTLPTDSKARKDYPLYSGVFAYFPAALAGVARISKIGNDKHNAGMAMHHARDKSTDHPDCLLRHLTDTADALAKYERNPAIDAPHDTVLLEVSALVWRALAFSQELHERFGAPLAPGAVVSPVEPPINKISLDAPCVSNFEGLVYQGNPLLSTKFKVGDKVRIRHLQPKEEALFVSEASFNEFTMRAEFGKEGRLLASHIPDYFEVVTNLYSECGWTWPAWALERI